MIPAPPFFYSWPFHGKIICMHTFTKQTIPCQCHCQRNGEIQTPCWSYHWSCWLVSGKQRLVIQPMANLSYQVQSATGERHAQWCNHFFGLSLPPSPLLSVAQIHEMLLKDLHIGGCRRWRIDHTQPPHLITCFYEPILTIVRATSNPPHIRLAADLYRGKQTILFNQTQMKTSLPSKLRFSDVNSKKQQSLK